MIGAHGGGRLSKRFLDTHGGKGAMQPLHQLRPRIGYGLDKAQYALDRRIAEGNDRDTGR